ncbi:hypothetical protein B0H19DRAFT_1057398 [Mycena capillaripes]|nr:hypothetical protein B0H19DRAFT_1057398 [Mycena capillaripes]
MPSIIFPPLSMSSVAAVFMALFTTVSHGASASKIKGNRGDTGIHPKQSLASSRSLGAKELHSKKRIKKPVWRSGTNFQRSMTYLSHGNSWKRCKAPPSGLAGLTRRIVHKAFLTSRFPPQRSYSIWRVFDRYKYYSGIIVFNGFCADVFCWPILEVVVPVVIQAENCLFRVLMPFWPALMEDLEKLKEQGLKA